MLNAKSALQFFHILSVSIALKYIKAPNRESILYGVSWHWTLTFLRSPLLLQKLEAQNTEYDDDYLDDDWTDMKVSIYCICYLLLYY